MTELKKHLLPCNNIARRKVKSIPPKTNKRATIEFQLTELQQSKAAGLDNFPSGLLKDSAKEISSSLCYIINRSIDTGVFSSSWKIVKVMHVYNI